MRSASNFSAVHSLFSRMLVFESHTRIAPIYGELGSDSFPLKGRMCADDPGRYERSSNTLSVFILNILNVLLSDTNILDLHLHETTIFVVYMYMSAKYPVSHPSILKRIYYRSGTRCHRTISHH